MAELSKKALRTLKMLNDAFNKDVKIEYGGTESGIMHTVYDPKDGWIQKIFVDNPTGNFQHEVMSIIHEYAHLLSDPKYVMKDISHGIDFVRQYQKALGAVENQELFLDEGVASPLSKTVYAYLWMDLTSYIEIEMGQTYHTFNQWMEFNDFVNYVESKISDPALEEKARQGAEEMKKKYEEWKKKEKKKKK